MSWKPGDHWDFPGRVLKSDRVIGMELPSGRIVGFEVVGKRGRWGVYKLWDREVRLLRRIAFLRDHYGKKWVYSNDVVDLGGSLRVDERVGVMVRCGYLVRRRFQLGGRGPWRVKYKLSGSGVRFLAGLEGDMGYRFGERYMGIVKEDDYTLDDLWDLGL